MNGELEFMRDILSERLAAQVLIFDGAMGTEIYRRNFFVNTCFDELCLSAPKIIGEIHREYFDAGADVLTTNTFGANRNKLSRFGFGEKAGEINAAAVRLARKNGSENTLVAGSVGPVGKLQFHAIEAYDKTIEIMAEQISALEEAGADFIMFETLSSVAEVEYAFKAANVNSKLPYVISMSVDRNGESSNGESLENLLRACHGKGRKPSALGLNCGSGPEGILSVLELLTHITEFPIIVKPNAGMPKNVQGRMIYMASPEYFTTYALRFVNMGARGVGGCCGTTPAHISDLARSIKPLVKSTFSSRITAVAKQEDLKEPVPMAEKSKFGAKLAAGKWVVTVEIVPPRGYDLSQTIEKSIQCKKAGVDAINIPDGPRASSRMSPMITSLAIQKEAGIETILHFCCRDRNLIGMQADLLGCASAGINNLLFITGDPPKLGDYPYASAVFDADSIGMVKIQSRLNRGVDLGGHSINQPTRALIGVGADPNAIDMEREIRRTKEKIEAGAEFIITQPVFAIKPLLEFLHKIKDFKIPVIAGIWPLISYRNAEFMKHEVPGVVVPDSIMTRMGKAKTKEEQREEGIRIARESIAGIRDRVCGIQVSAPLGNVATAIEVIKEPI